MKIIEYVDKYLEDVKDLLVELERYILSIDKDNLDQLHPEYRDKMAFLDLEEVKSNDGKCYIAIENDKAVGLIMGCIFPYDEYDYLDYKCPKRGEIPDEITFLCSNVICFQSFIFFSSFLQGNIKYIITILISVFYNKAEIQNKFNVY